MFPVQVARGDPGATQSPGESVDHSSGPAQEHRQPTRVGGGVGGGVGQDLLRGEVAVRGGIDHMQVDVVVIRDNRRDLLARMAPGRS